MQDIVFRYLQGHSNTDWDAVRNETMQQQQNNHNNMTVGNSTFVTSGAADEVEYAFSPADIIYYTLSVIGLCLFCYCSRSRVPDARFRVAAAERRARFLEGQERKERMGDEEYRTRLVMRGLVVKKVMDEKDGQLTLGDDEQQPEDDDNNSDDGSSGGGSLISIDSNDENVSTCVICLEAFRVGDVVAWSRTLLDATDEETCNHVFHKDCIVSWLMQPTHDDCPSCRSAIVHEDEDGKESPDEAVAHTNAAFVIMHGLVSRVRRASYSLIGQNIDIDDYEDDDDIESGYPKDPPSPLRRVFSLEGSAQTQRSSSLRRRVSSSTQSNANIALPELADRPPGPPSSSSSSSSPSVSPLVLRRVVSDLTRAPQQPGSVLAPNAPASRDTFLGRHMPHLPHLPPLRPRVQNRAYHSVSWTPETSERSLDDEDDILIYGGSERMEDDDVILEHEAC